MLLVKANFCLFSYSVFLVLEIKTLKLKHIWEALILKCKHFLATFLSRKWRVKVNMARSIGFDSFNSLTPTSFQSEDIPKIGRNCGSFQGSLFLDKINFLGQAASCRLYVEYHGKLCHYGVIWDECVNPNADKKCNTVLLDICMMTSGCAPRWSTSHSTLYSYLEHTFGKLSFWK